MANLCAIVFYGFVATLALANARPTSASSDGCDWIGSGFDHPNQERGVQPVYLRCSQGSVLWRWPRGALRIVLRLGSAGREFRGCIRVNSPRWRGGRVYLEGDRQLHLLYSPKDDKPAKLHRCFASTNGQAALYVEADAASSTSMSTRDKAEFIYDLQPLRITDDNLEECRPCTDDELLHNFCVSDFVAKGAITSVIDDHSLERSEIRVKVHRVVRDASTPIFHQSNNIDSDQIRVQYSTLLVPSKCHVRHGSGDFLFMGRLKLGEPVLKCAPRLDDWDKLQKEATRTGRTLCTTE